MTNRACVMVDSFKERVAVHSSPAEPDRRTHDADSMDRPGDDIATAELPPARGERRSRRPAGAAGARTCRSASGARSARTTRPTATAWEYLPHDHARSRAYRWGEDGLLGICDDQARLCLALALWNGAGPDPQGAPLRRERHRGQPRRGRQGALLVPRRHADPQLPPGRVRVSAAGASRMPTSWPRAGGGRRPTRSTSWSTPASSPTTASSTSRSSTRRRRPRTSRSATRSPTAAPSRRTLHLLPTLWFRNTWAWGRHKTRPTIEDGRRHLGASRACSPAIPRLGRLALVAEDGAELLFTDNETNAERLFGAPNAGPYVKDGIGRCGRRGRGRRGEPGADRVEGRRPLRARAGGRRDRGSCASGSCRSSLRRGRRRPGPPDAPPPTRRRPRPPARRRRRGHRRPAGRGGRVLCAARRGRRQRRRAPRPAPGVRRPDLVPAVVRTTTSPSGSTATRPSPLPRPSGETGRNARWRHMNATDVMSMPDTWEYPWFAAWDLAFHCVPLAQIDAEFAKAQLILLTREWFMHPNGQLPAYEWALGDVNPPVHAWAARRVYQIDARINGRADRAFLERVFHKLLLNFTWWVNRKDADGNNIFQGGFLGLDNVGVFDRSAPLPVPGHLGQADGTAWMGMYCLNMLAIALELAREDPVYEDVATKFFEHFMSIAGALNGVGVDGEERVPLWDPDDEFFYDVLHLDSGEFVPLKIRSMVGLIPLLAVETLDESTPRGAAGLPRAGCAGSWPIGRTWPASSRRGSSRARAGGGCFALVHGHRLKRILAPDARPRGVPVRPRRPLAQPSSPRPPVHARPRRRHEPGGLRARPNRGPASSAATRTGAGRSGSRSTTCSSRRSSGSTTTTGRTSPWSARPAPARSRSMAGVADDLSRRLERLFLRDATGRRPAFGTPWTCSRTTPRCATGSCSTSTSTARPGPGSGPATRPAGRRSWPSSSSRRAGARCCRAGATDEGGPRAGRRRRSWPTAGRSWATSTPRRPPRVARHERDRRLRDGHARRARPRAAITAGWSRRPSRPSAGGCSSAASWNA